MKTVVDDRCTHEEPQVWKLNLHEPGNEAVLLHPDTNKKAADAPRLGGFDDLDSSHPVYLPARCRSRSMSVVIMVRPRGMVLP